MKQSLSLLLLATFACVAPGLAQQTAEDAANAGFLKRPKPSPSVAATTAHLNKPLEASLSDSGKGKSSAPSMESFPATTEKIYVNFTHEGATKGQKLQVAWIADDAKGLAKHKTLTTSSGTLPGPGATGSYYLPGKGLPTGKYRVDVSEDGKVVKSLKFAVK